VVFNRANVALARNQRLVESWLPPRAPEPVANIGSSAEQVKDEEEMFTPVPELLGVGAIAQSNVQSKAAEMSAMDKLKRQLLGKGARVSKDEPAKKKPLQRVSSSAGGALDDDDSQEEEGRVGAISSKSAPRAKSRNTGVISRSDEVSSIRDQLNYEQNNRPVSATKGSKRHSSFLDEVLSNKTSAKKKRKKQN